MAHSFDYNLGHYSIASSLYRYIHRTTITLSSALSRDGWVRVVWHLDLSVEYQEGQTGEEDVCASEIVRVLTTRPVLDGTVSGCDETCLDGDTDDSSDLEDDLSECSTDSCEFLETVSVTGPCVLIMSATYKREGLDDRGLH